MAPKPSLRDVLADIGRQMIAEGLRNGGSTDLGAAEIATGRALIQSTGADPGVIERAERVAADVARRIYTLN